MERQTTPTIRDLYPHLNEEELLIAEDNLERYLRLMLTIFERMEAAGELDQIPPAEWIPDTAICEKCGKMHPLDRSERLM